MKFNISICLIFFVGIFLIVSTSRGDEYCNNSTCAKEALPYAMLSSSVYDNDGEVDGWKIIKNYNWFDGCRLLWNRIFNIECGFDGFHATLYKKDGKDEYVLAFRGTNGPMDLFVTDLVQYATSVDSQYDQAVNITNELLTIGYNGTALRRDNLTLTGHSLGGGLATVASLSTGLKAYIFNPARIGYAGIPIIDSHLDSKIKAFVSYDLASGRKDFVASQGWQDIWSQTNILVPIPEENTPICLIDTALCDYWNADSSSKCNFLAGSQE